MPDLTEKRRIIHRCPELGYDLPETISFVKSVLAPLSCEISEPIKGAVCAYFDMGKAETVAIRADMDGLPIEEKTGAGYASLIPGRMHACGHDGHTAILLETAERISGSKLDKNVLLVFQPAEETTGGALPLCRSGVFKKYNVSAVFGLHLFPDLPEGKVFSRPGPLMAGTRETDVVFTGESCHIAQYKKGKDAALAAAVFMTEAYKMAAGREDMILRFGKIAGGTYRNAVCSECRLTGTMRYFDDVRKAEGEAIYREAIKKAEKETGCRGELLQPAGVDPVINDEKLFGYAEARLGPGLSRFEGTVYTAEDFSAYGHYLPSLFFFLGTGGSYPLHSPQFDFDERVLEKGVELFLNLI